MGRAERVTEEIKRHDYKLFCEKDPSGKLVIYRKTTRTESYNFDGNVIHFVRPAKYFVCALTKNWKFEGEPVEWGLDPILRRLQEMDLWSRDIVSELEQQYEKNEKATERAMKNSNEAFLSDNRNRFKDAFKDINVANLSKPKVFKTKKEL